MAFFCPDCHRRFDPGKRNLAKVTCPYCEHTFPVPDEYRDDVLATGAKIGNFEITRLIGTGGMGKVYEARQISLNRRVALKILSRKRSTSEKMMQRFLVEVRATASLQHPNIVTVYEADIKGDLLFLAMAYVDGQSVDKTLESTNKPIPERDALLYAQKVAEAMAYAWRHQKLLHRDIKPANIIIDRTGAVHLCDLGIAKRPTDEVELASAGMAIGTPHYMSPEQGQGLVDLDFRSDIYSLGASLFHMVTGTLPFDAEDAVNVITKQIMEPLPDPQERNPKVSRETCKLLQLMMGKLPEQRHSSWDELIHDIQRVRKGLAPAFRVRPPHLTTDETPSQKVEHSETTKHVAILPRPEPDHHRFLQIGGLLFLLLFLLGLTVHYLHTSTIPNPYADQILQPDDGSSPVPTEVDNRPPPLSLGNWRDPLQALPDRPPGDLPLEEEIKYILRDGRRAGLSPLTIARRLQQDGRPTAAEAILWYCVKDYHGPDGRWAAAAAGDLAERFLNLNNEGDWIGIQTERLEFARIGQPQEAADAYVALADYHEREKRLADAETLLRSGLAKYGAEYPVVADLLTLRLMTMLSDHDRDAELKTMLAEVLRSFPENSRSFLFATTMSHHIDPHPPPAREDPAAARKRLADRKAKQLQNELNRARDTGDQVRILFKLAELYKREQVYDDAVHYWQQIVTKYGRRNQGAVGARALLAMADHYAEREKMAEWQRSLYTLLTNKYFGPGGKLGLRAATDLANYYEKQKNSAMQKRYLRMIIEEMPGAKGDNAGAAALKLARLNEREKHNFLARGLLQQVVKDYPGSRGQHRKRATAELKRLEAKMAIKNPLPKPKINTGPFKQVISFDSLKEQYIEFAQINRTISNAAELTIECWFRQNTKVNFPQSLICRHGGNRRGFDLYIENARITFQFSDGRKDYAIDSDAIDIDKWHHVAAVVTANQVRLYIDGKRVAHRTGKTLNNQGGGRLRIGRHSKRDLTHFDGAMQNIIITPKALYKDDFKPKPKPRDTKNATVYIVADDKGIHDRKGNKLSFLP